MALDGAAGVLRNALADAGVEVLGVTPHDGVADTFTVFLHGLAGQWIEGEARRTIAHLPGVAAVTQSLVSETILQVRLGKPETAYGCFLAVNDLELGER